MIPEPWKRVGAVAIPEGNLTDILLEMPQEEFGRLIHANLAPRDPSGAGRQPWSLLWATVAGDQDLTDSATEHLQSWKDACTAAAPTADANTARRISKFQRQADEALNRLDQPLAWAGVAAVKFNVPARRVIEQLVDAICAHRNSTTDPTDSDRALWAAMDALGLDPDHQL